MKTDVETFSPEQAKVIFDRDVKKNWRKFCPHTGKLYSQEMGAGRWVLNGEAIKFNRAGDCVDGIHRLYGCADSGVPLTTVVVRDVDDATVPSLDGGKKRKVANYLDAARYKNTTVLAAAARLVMLHERSKPLITRGPEAMLTPLNAKELINRHPRLCDAVHMANSCKTVAPASAVAAVIYLGEMLPHDGQTVFAEEFAHGIAKGVGLGEHDPRYRLRARLIEDRTKKSRLPQDEKLAITVIAWNAWASEKPVRVLRWTSYGPRQATFPTIELAPKL